MSEGTENHIHDKSSLIGVKSEWYIQKAKPYLPKSAPYTQTIASLNLAIFLSFACACVKKCVTLQADYSKAIH
jgi:hypothetical protein